ncbi:MAG: hypothetical protein HKO02_08585 [Hyphomonadaceae bacterium]|nr:hypothetical protein [Hyphomonadaceae bacterium]
MMKIVKLYSQGVIALTTALISMVFLGFASQDNTVLGPTLSPPSSNQNIYVIGNSMFGTGLNLSGLRSAFPNETVDFAYYNGYYTSMWNLAINRGMNEQTVPETIVWGFRPTYAILPAFRQNTPTKELDFAKDMPDRHRDILVNAGDPAFASAEGVESSPLPANNYETTSLEPFEVLGARLTAIFKTPFEAMNGEVDLLDSGVANVSSILSRTTVSQFPNLNLFDEVGNKRKPNDLLISYVTGGEIQVADGLIVDNGERFITGREVEFSDSFVPEIYSSIQKLDAKQVVVIFKPVSAFDKPLPQGIQKYYDDAVKFFEEMNVTVVDLNVDPELSLEMYAKGDHFNESGRKFVTGRIIEGIEKTRRSNRSRVEDKCLASIELALKSMNFNVLASEQLPDRTLYTIEQTDDSAEPASVICKFDTNGLTELVYRNSRMPRSILPQPSVRPGEFRRLSGLAHRPLTTSDADGGIVKYYARLDFQATAAGEYCLSVQHFSASEGQNSIFVAIDGSGWEAVNLPVNSTRRVITEISSPRLSINNPDVYPIRIKHRENTLTYGFSVERCSAP